MPTPALDEEIVKVTLNLYHADVALLKKHAPRGVGWSVYVRDLVHDHCKALRRNLLVARTTDEA